MDEVDWFWVRDLTMWVIIGLLFVIGIPAVFAWAVRETREKPNERLRQTNGDILRIFLLWFVAYGAIIYVWWTNSLIRSFLTLGVSLILGFAITLWSKISYSKRRKDPRNWLTEKR